MKTTLTNSFDKIYLTIEFDAANQWVYTNWTGVLPTEKVVQGGQAIIDFLRENRCAHLLSDNREIIGSWNSANDWIVTDWLPQVLALGLKRFAHIMSPGIFGQASAQEMAARVGSQLDMRLFKDAELAKQWLSS